VLSVCKCAPIAELPALPDAPSNFSIQGSFLAVAKNQFVEISRLGFRDL